MEAISKLQPDRTLEMAFVSSPSADAALHSTSSSGWEFSGAWRRQNDYAIVQWNRDNRFDHPRLRYLPDGDLSGLTLEYDETRTNCQPMESADYPFTDWPWLLIYATPPGGTERIYRVPLKDHAVIASGALAAASGNFTLTGTAAAGDVLTVAIMEERWTYIVQPSDTLESITSELAGAVEDGSTWVHASSSGAEVTLTARAPGVGGSRVAWQVTLYHFAAKATGQLSYSGNVQTSPASVASATVNGRVYTVSAWTSETLDDVIYRLAAQMQSDPEVDAAWAAGGFIAITAKSNGDAGNAIALAASGSNGLSGTVSQAMSGGRDEGNGALVTITPSCGLLAGGSSSTVTWRVTLDFGALADQDATPVPCDRVRLLRWVYSPALQNPQSAGGSSEFTACEFDVAVANWSVTGTVNTLQVAGSLSQRIEDDDARSSYAGAWGVQSGNVSGQTMHYTTQAGATLQIIYSHPFAHDLYLGTQRTFDSGIAAVSVDEGPEVSVDLFTPGQFPNDIFPARERLAPSLAPGRHTVRITHSGTKNAASTGLFLYVDFLEAAVPSDVADSPAVHQNVGLATDYDTAALYLSPERLAWSIDKLGLKGEIDHFAGVEYWYEKYATEWATAFATIELGGEATPGDVLYLQVGGSLLAHAVGYGDTLESIARIVAAAANSFTSVRGQASGTTITIHSRVPGTAGNGIELEAYANEGATETTSISGDLTGGVDGSWLVDGAAASPLNRSARDWHRAFATACNARSIALRIALSLELKHAPAAWGQKFSDETTVITGNGTVQTSPSVPEAVWFWKAAYLAFAGVMHDAGAIPRLQWGEVQWWYFAGGTPPSMAYYDEATKADAATALGRPLHVFTSPADDPGMNQGADADWLRGRLAAFCDQVRAHVLGAYSNADFEVLWPRDVNDPDFNPLNYRVNLALSAWTPEKIAAFKTEAFAEANPQRNMNKARTTVRFPFETLSFTLQGSRHLLGVMPGFPWEKELAVARSDRIGLTTLWAWDQFCAVGRRIPLPAPLRTSQFIGR